MNNFKLQKGFTLIEMIIVVGIIAILSVGVLTVLNPGAQFSKAGNAKRKSDLSQIQKALESYYADRGRYPPNPLASDYRIRGLDGNPVNWGSSWQPFMNVLPKDSLPKTYAYYVSPDGQAYWLYASLDRSGSDPQSCNNGNACGSLASQGIAPSICGAICNFGVSSPNVSP